MPQPHVSEQLETLRLQLEKAASDLRGLAEESIEMDKLVSTIDPTIGNGLAVRRALADHAYKARRILRTPPQGANVTQRPRSPRARLYNRIYKRFLRDGFSKEEAAKAAREAAGAAPPRNYAKGRCPTCGAFTRRIVADGEPDAEPPNSPVD